MKTEKIQLNPEKTIFLIDGSSFLYRAYYSLKPLHAPDGRPIQAVYSFCRMIKKVIKDFNPSHLVLVWDSPGQTERHELYSEYKSQRQAPPSDLFDQKELIVKFADLIGLKQVAHPGIEADDIMFSIAQEQKKLGNTTVFITSDKDMSQAISGQTIMRFDPFKSLLVDENVFEEIRGFPVKKLPFYFALLGDASDNIPGVRGIGKTGALELVQRFNSLQDLYEHLNQVQKPRMKKALLEYKENAFLSEKLFTLHYKPTNLVQKDLYFNNAQWSSARPLFEELRFTSLIKELDAASATLPNQIEPSELMTDYTFKTITTKNELEDLAKQLKQKKKFAIDTETTSIYPMSAQLVGISIACTDSEAYYIPIAHKTGTPQVTVADIQRILGPYLQDSTIKKYLHNAKYDQLVLHTHNLFLKGPLFDSMIAARLVCREWQRIGLKALSEFFFKETMISYDQVVTTYKHKNFSYADIALATRYAGSDALQTFRLGHVLEQRLAEQQMNQLYHNIEQPLQTILYHMESEGIKLDTTYLDDLRMHVITELHTIERNIFALLGHEYETVNLRSPKQLEKLLFEDLNLPRQKKSSKKTGYSTDNEVLKTLAPLHPVVSLLMHHRELTKLKNTYLDALPTYVNPRTHRIHTSYNQTAVATGRLASSHPNLQNIPVSSTSFGGAIRTAFTPNVGNVFLSADYSQIELRILAHMSQDSTLLYAFEHGYDIHTQTASHIFGLPQQQITQEQRQIGKRINFSILYGLTPYGLSKDLAIQLGQAKEYIERYFAQYPAVKVWMEKTITNAKECGYVQSLYGRRRYVPALHEKNKHLYQEACRVAINTVAQGTAADIIKLGMIRLVELLKEHKLNATLLLQIHDELLLEVPEQELSVTQEVVKDALEGVVDWKPNLAVTLRSGLNWSEVTK
jgi:DNA polymerase I